MVEIDPAQTLHIRLETGYHLSLSPKETLPIQKDMKLTTTTWTSELETGISAMDHDHRTLFDLANKVIIASEKSDLSGLKSSLLELQTELIAHFEREENLMADCIYEAAAQHQEEHQQLAGEIQEQINDLDTDKGNVTFIARFMRNWLLRHIVTKDAHFGKALLTQRGITDRRHTADDGIDIFDERRLGRMEAIQWTPALELGIASIDANHRAMVDTLNAILATRQANDKAKLAALLEQLGNETVADFQTEEALMLQLSVENLATHKEEHRQLLDEFANQVDDWRENRISAELLCRFMHHWLIRHIAALDIPLAMVTNKLNA